MTMPTSNGHEEKRARVAVVAAGVISPLGAGLKATLVSLSEARDCVSPVTRFPVAQCRCKTAGQVDDAWLTSIYLAIGELAASIAPRA